MIRWIESKEDFFALKDEWNALLGTMESPCIFLTWEWMYTWWDYYISADSSCRLFILLISEDNGKLSGIFPGFLKNCRGISGIHHIKLGFLGSGIEAPDHLDIIAGPSKKEGIINEIFGYFRGPATKIDIIELTDIDEDSGSTDLLLKTTQLFNYSATKHIASTCPYLKLSSDYEKYVSSLSLNFRSHLKRRTKGLMEKERAVFDEVREKNELQDIVNRLFLLHLKRWQKKIDKTIFYSENRQKFHSRLAAAFQDSSFLRLFFLSVDSEVVACLYCFEYGDKMYFYQSGFDPDWALKSVGTVLMGKVIETCILEKKIEFDFLRGAEAYKRKWTSDSRQTYNVIIGLTKKGKFISFCRMAIRDLKKGLKRFGIGYRLYKKLTSSG
jgi:hypothetical protein